MKKYDIDGCTGYSDILKLESGQTIKIEFQEEWNKSKYYYGIYLVTYHKRKQESDAVLTTTGKDGLKGLLWAKDKIEEFEKFIKEEHRSIPVIIYCKWDCNRRRNVYERGLRRLGYKYNTFYNKKVLLKTI